MKKTGMLLVAAVLFLAVAGWLNRPLLERRQTLRPPNQTDLRQAPPLVAFTTVALGGFRGILADVLWLRISTLQDEGRYFEITQLADWITKLEPTFTEVWSYHAWNMAYNIGLLFDNPADRWRWVENGIRMLREGGLRENPDNPRLCWELGWMYFNKIGGFADNAAGYYQFQLYQAMESVLPGGFLKEERPDAALRGQFRLEGSVMARVDHTLGPLDWRLPESQAVYWAWVGREHTKGPPDLFLERLLYQAMIGSCLRGRLVCVPERQIQVRLVRLDLFFPALHQLAEARRLFPDDDGICSANDFLMRAAIFELYAHGLDEPARNLLDRYRQEHPLAPADLASFAMAEATGGRQATAGYLGRVESLFFDAEIARLQGRRSVAERLDTLATYSFDGMASLVKKAGETLPFTMDEARDKVRQQAQAVRQAGRTP